MLTSPCAKFLVTKTLKQPLVSVEDFFSPSNLSSNFFCTKWYTLYSYDEQQGKLFFLCTANWRVSNLNFLLKNDKYSLPCCYKKYIFQPYLFLCCCSVFVKKELICWSQNNLEPFSSLLVAKTQTIREFLESNFFSSLINSDFKISYIFVSLIVGWKRAFLFTSNTVKPYNWLKEYYILWELLSSATTTWNGLYRPLWNRKHQAILFRSSNYNPWVTLRWATYKSSQIS